MPAALQAGTGQQPSARMGRASPGGARRAPSFGTKMPPLNSGGSRSITLTQFGNKFAPSFSKRNFHFECWRRPRLQFRRQLKPFRHGRIFPEICRMHTNDRSGRAYAAQWGFWIGRPGGSTAAAHGRIPKEKPPRPPFRHCGRLVWVHQDFSAGIATHPPSAERDYSAPCRRLPQ
jgi:hypothetical protein